MGAVAYTPSLSTSFWSTIQRDFKVQGSALAKALAALEAAAKKEATAAGGTLTEFKARLAWLEAMATIYKAVAAGATAAAAEAAKAGQETARGCAETMGQLANSALAKIQ